MQHLSINVPLDEVELSALAIMADAACRAPREHMRYLLRRHAKRRGLLPDPQQKTPPVAASWPANATDEANQNPARVDHTNEIED